MRERCGRQMSSTASYTGFKAVEGFQYPFIWKKAAQSVGAVLLVLGAAALSCGVELVCREGATCRPACSRALIAGVAICAVASLDLVLHVLLLVSLRRGWPAGTIATTVWDALKGASSVYLLVRDSYQLHTQPDTVLFQHYVAVVALVLCMAVFIYTLASAAHELRSANKIDGDTF